MTSISTGETFTGEDMTQVCTASGAGDLSPSAIFIGHASHFSWDLLVKGWPATMRIKFTIGSIERCIAASADIDTITPKLIILASERCFGGFVFNNALFLRCEWIIVHNYDSIMSTL